MNRVFEPRCCEICGQIYIPTGNSQKYCIDCKKKHRKEYEKEYYDRPEIKQHMKKYLKEYHQRPEIKQRQKEYWQSPETKQRVQKYKEKNKEHIRQQDKEYRSRPEVKERIKEYQQRPEVKERHREQERKHRQQPGRIQHMKEYRQRPEVKKRMREYQQHPEVKERKRESDRKSYKKNIEKRKEYYQRPEVKRHIKERNEKKREYMEVRDKKYRLDHKEKIKLLKANGRKKRNTVMKNIVLFSNPFPNDIDVDYHHLLNDFYNMDSHKWFMIPLPASTHTFMGGNTSDREHWRFCAEWIKKLYNIDIKELLEGNLV